MKLHYKSLWNLKLYGLMIFYIIFNIVTVDSPLNLAIKNKNEKIVRLLLANPDIDVNMKSIMIINLWI